MNAPQYFLLYAVNKKVIVLYTFRRHYSFAYSTTTHQRKEIWKTQKKHRRTGCPTTKISGASKQARKKRKTQSERSEYKDSPDIEKKAFSTRITDLAVPDRTCLYTPKITYFWYCSLSYDSNEQGPVNASAKADIKAA